MTVMHAGSPVQVRLPAGGWQVGFRAQPGGRTVVEVTDPGGSLVAHLTSAGAPVLSIHAGWAGATRGPDGSRTWWALAIGRVPADAGQPAVTFTRSAGRSHSDRKALPAAVDGLWVVHDGLWIAAAAGRYHDVRLRVGSATRVQRLRPAGVSR